MATLVEVNETLKRVDDNTENTSKGIDSFVKYLQDNRRRELENVREQKKIDFDIEIDGGINFDNCKSAIDAGANILVSGTTVFKSNDGDIKKNINLLKLK